MTDRITSVTRQGVNVKFLRSAFHAYNSGSDNGYRFCSRSYDPDQGRSRLIWQRRENDHLIAEEPVEIEGGGSLEDARMFSHFGNRWISFTEGFYDRTPFLATQRIAVLGPDFQPVEKITIKYGRNGTRSEKNWQFFDWNAKLHFVYSISPHVVVQTAFQFSAARSGADATVVTDYVTGAPIHWPWGDSLRGGTPPILRAHPDYGAVYLSFFHSYAAHRERQRRYAMGAYIFRPDPPFSIIAISEVVLRASENDVTYPNPSVPNWRPLVVFPCGVWPTAEIGRIGLAFGVNDSMDAIAELDPWKDLRWHPVDYYREPVKRFFRCENGPLPLVLRGGITKWKLGRAMVAGPHPGYMATSDPNIIEAIERRLDAAEITEEQYREFERG